MECLKKSFETKQEAKERKEQIDKVNQLNKDNTRMRVYHCKKCGKYHLTSMSKKKFKSTQKITKEERDRRRISYLVNVESDYWLNKLGIE